MQTGLTRIITNNKLKKNKMKTNKEKLTMNEVNNIVVVHKLKPAYTVSSIIIDECDNIYLKNGSDYFSINFMDEAEAIIKKTDGNLGWYAIDKSSGNQFLKQTLDALYAKDYIGKKQ